jgi:hypothetical protein
MRRDASDKDAVVAHLLPALAVYPLAVPTFTEAPQMLW